MTLDPADWAGQLQESLEHWSKGRRDVGGRGLQQVIAKLEGPAMAFWRALLHNQLALVSHEMGHEKYARTQWQQALHHWNQSGLMAGSSDLDPTLDWYRQLLTYYGFEDRSQAVNRLHQAGKPPLLDPFSPLPQVAENDQESAWMPLGGKTVAQLGQAKPVAVEAGKRDWDEFLKLALQLAAQGKLQPALGYLDGAKEIALLRRDRDDGHLLSLVYCSESICAFLTGDYSLAGQAKQESVRMWAGLGDNPNVYLGDVHDRFVQALRESGQEQAAQLFGERHRKKTFPLLDPWTDLETGLTRGNWQAEEFHLEKEWQKRLDVALKHHSRGSFMEALKGLGLLEQKLTPEQSSSAPGALVLQLQSLVSYAAGDYDAAQELFRKAQLQWDSLAVGGRRQPPYLDQVKSLLTMYNMGSLADQLGESLCDPFLSYKSEMEMARVEAASPSQEDGENPRDSWESQLTQAWELAKKGRWEQAQRRAAHAQRVARLLAADDLRVAYSLNSQAIFANESGEYKESEELFSEAQRCWKRGSHAPSARTAWNEFCQLLRQSSWELLAMDLEAKWSKPVARSAFDPALLAPDCLNAASMPVIETVQEENEDDGVLRLPAASKKRRERPSSQANWGARIFIAVLLLTTVVTLAWFAYKRFRPL